MNESGSSKQVFFVYDESGRLLSELVYPKIGFFLAVRREYIYLEDIPVAVIDYESGQSTYYIHADHLGTPRAVTDKKRVKRWEWQFRSNPFGEKSPNEDPERTGERFTLNLRFPGQYFDAETGLHYNYFRDYEPQTGRYVQSDPIGLAGGLATYQYAYASPLIFGDRFGLDPEMDPFDRLPTSPFPVIDLYCKAIGGCDDGEFNEAVNDVTGCALECVRIYLGGELMGVPQGYVASKLSRELARGLGKVSGAYGMTMFYLCLDSCGTDECR